MYYQQNHLQQLLKILIGHYQFLKNYKSQMVDVLQVPRDEVVHGHYSEAFSDEPVAEVGSEKASRAGDENTLHQ